MSQEISRRSVFSLLGATATVFVSGCFGSAYDPPPGSLTLSNHHDQSHTVTVTVTTDGETRSEEFTIRAGKSRTIEGYISQAGTHTVVVEADTGDTREMEVETTIGANGLAGQAFSVSVMEDGDLITSAGIYD